MTGVQTCALPIYWTDNQPGTADDRYLNPAKSGRNQALFIAFEAMMAQAFQKTDPAYARACLEAATRCWKAWKRGAAAIDRGWAVLGDIALWRATGRDEYAASATRTGGLLLALQNTEHIGNQKRVRGFWRASETDPSPLADAVHPALPALALLELAEIGRASCRGRV